MSLDPNQVRYAQLYARGVACRLRINDIPVTEGAADEMTTAAMPIRQFTVRGENTVEVICANASGAPKGGYDGLAQVMGRVADFWEGDTLGSDGGIERAKVIPEFTEDTPNPLSVGTRYVSDIGGDWAWARAPVLDLVSMRPHLDQMMAYLRDRFAARDMGSLVPLYEPAIRDRVAAYPVLSINGQINATRGRLAMTDPEKWRVMPFDPAQAVYRPCAFGRMVEPLGRDGLPLIRSDWIANDDADEPPSYVALTNLIGLSEGQLKFLV